MATRTLAGFAADLDYDDIVDDFEGTPSRPMDRDARQRIIAQPSP